MELLLDHCLLVPTDDNCRICVAHLDGDHLIKGLEVTRTFLKDADDPDDQQATLDPLEAATVIEDLIHAVRTYRSMSHLSFDNEGALNDEEYQLWTGWTKDQFNSFLQHLQGMRNSKQRSIRTSLAIFWIKLKTDLSFGHIASLLGIKRGDSEAGRLIAAEAFHAVENLLAANFVQLHLGPAHMTPEEAKITQYCVLKDLLWGALPNDLGWHLPLHVQIFKLRNQSKVLLDAQTQTSGKIHVHCSSRWIRFGNNWPILLRREKQ